MFCSRTSSRAGLLALTLFVVFGGVFTMTAITTTKTVPFNSETKQLSDGAAFDIVTTQYGTTMSVQYAIASDESNYVDSYQMTGPGSVLAFDNMAHDDDSYTTLKETGTIYGDVDYQYGWAPSGVPYEWRCDNTGPYGWHYSESDDRIIYGGSTRLDGPLFPWESARSGNLYSPNYNLYGCSHFTFSCYLNDYNLDSTDLQVYFRDRNMNWRYMFNIDECTAPDGAGWRFRIEQVYDPDFIHNYFEVRYEAYNVGFNQVVCLDGHRIQGFVDHSFEGDFKFNAPIHYDSFEKVELRISLAKLTNWGGVVVPLQIFCLQTYIGKISNNNDVDNTIATFDITNLLRDSWNGGDLVFNFIDYDNGQTDINSQQWLIQRMYLYMYNDGPGNIREPSSDSLFESNNLLACKSLHSGNYAYITTYHSHSEGYQNITECRLAGYYSESVLWEVCWNATGYFVVSGNLYVFIDTGEAIGNGEYLNITWHIGFKWEHPHIENISLRVMTGDLMANDTDIFNVNWNVRTRLKDVGISITDQVGYPRRGSINGNIAVSGHIFYDGTSEPPNPWSVSFWVCAHLSTGWNNHSVTSDSAGFVVFITNADSVTGLRYYYFKATPYGSSVEYPSLFGTTLNNSYISDRILVEPLAYDTRVNVGTSVTVAIRLTYEYDGASVEGGTVTLGGSPAAYQGGGVWRVIDTLDHVGDINYSITCEDDLWGISALNQTLIDTVIWDRIIVLDLTVTSNRVSVDATITIVCNLAYEYDLSEFGGIVQISGVTASYFEEIEKWAANHSKSEIGLFALGQVSIVHDPYGITVVNQNSQYVDVIWDAVEIYDIGSDEWALIGTGFNAWCKARLVYDSTPLGAGDIIEIGNQEAVWNGTHFIAEIIAEHAGIWQTIYVNSTMETEYMIDAIFNLALTSTFMVDIPIIESVSSAFSPQNDLYLGICNGPPLWIHWDPLNDPTPPSFIFNISSACFAMLRVTSSWSGSIVLFYNVTGTPLVSTYTMIIEAGLPYSGENHTYTITVRNDFGIRTTYVVYVMVRDYTPPSVSSPPDTFYDQGSTGNTLTWNLDDLFPGTCRVITDGVTGSWATWLNGDLEVNIDGLSLGDHNITLEVKDVNGNIASDYAIIGVTDSISPTISHPANLVIFQGETGHTILWIGNDLNPGLYQLCMNGTLVFSGVWNSTADVFEIVLDGLEPGLYIYRLILFDSSLNSVEDVVEIRVQPMRLETTDSLTAIILALVGIAGLTVTLASVYFIRSRRTLP